ncbi:MAG: hypothetical protein ABIP13_00710 [Tepidiformaceae bacterium]
MAIVTLKDIRQPFGDTGVQIGSVEYGAMSMVSATWPPGFDATELLRAACGDVPCPVPHYLYVVRGALAVTYTDDGSEEIARGGEAAYLRPAHTIRILEDTEVFELSPADGNAHLMARIAAVSS